MMGEVVFIHILHTGFTYEYTFSHDYILNIIDDYTLKNLFPVTIYISLCGVANDYTTNIISLLKQ